MPLFENVLYHLSQSLPEETRIEIGRILDHNGAVETSLKNATHVISNTIEFEGCDTLAQDVFCVTPYWVERSMELGSLQDAHFFSADKAQFFSGVVATSADLLQGDKDVIGSGIEDRGGSWREGLTRDITHLIVTNTNSEKYRVAMHFRDSARITIVLPQWFDKCWELQMCIPTTLFQFPEPPFLKHEHDPAWYKAQLSTGTDSNYLKDGFDKKALFHVIAREPSFRERSPRDIWQGRRILLSASLELTEDRRKAVEARIRSAGGLVLSGSPDDEGTIVDSADVLVTRYRYGPAYSRALDKGKTIGSLDWFLYVDKTGVITRPRDELLHYPVRSEPIPGFEHHEITVTNYQGSARDYLKKLIQLMGATFTPTMSGKNTVVIAAYKSGTKTSKAEEWSVPVVHHKWLEDCFLEWRNLTPALKKYVDFAPGFNYGTLLGNRGVGHTGLAQVDKDKVQVPNQGQEVVVKTSTTPASPSKSPKRPPSAAADTGKLATTTTSFRDALEVEEVEEVLSAEPLPDAPIKFGPPRSASSPPKKKSLSKPLPISNAAAGLSKTSKPRAKKAPIVDEQEEEEEEKEEREEEERVEKEEKPKKKRPVAKEVTLSKSKRVSRPSTEPEQIDSDESIQEIPLPSKKIGLSKDARGFSAGSPRAKKAVKKTRKATAKDSSEEDADAEDLSEAPRPSSPAKSKSKSKSPTKPVSARRPLSSSTAPSSDDDEVMIVKSPKAPKSPTKTKAKTKDLSEDLQSSSPPKSKVRSMSPVKPVSVKRPLSPSAVDSSDSEVVETKRPKVVKTYKSPIKAKAKAARALSSPLSSSSSDEEDRAEASKKTKKAASGHKVVAQKAVRPSTSRAVTVELPEADTLLKKQVVKKKPPAKPSTSSKDDSDQLTPSLSDHSVSVMSLLNNTLTSRRYAAAAATEKLRTQVMPDVINYENERKKRAASTRRRKSSLGAALSANTGDGGDSDEASVRVIKKARTSAAAEESEDGGIRLVTHVRSFAKTVVDEDEVPRGSGKKGRGSSKPRNGAAAKEPGGSSSMDPRKIRIMTTKVDVPDDVEQALTKLGMKFTTKPSECTHLVASGMARTEKFLCALPQAPYVLGKDWLTACVKEKRAVAEEPYALQDPDVEHKHKFKLSEALKRANDLKKKKVKLLQGHTFYITPNVKVDHNMLINILKANGAEGKRATPNARNLSDSKHVHVLSCQKDEHLWRGLHKGGIPIYSQELVLSAAFKQLIDWDSPEMKVDAEAD